MIQVGIIMGSKSDLPVMQNAIDILKEFEIEIEVDIVSAHRTPKKMFEYAENAKMNRYKSYYCWSWWSRSFTWNDCIPNNNTRYRGTCKVQ